MAINSQFYISLLCNIALTMLYCFSYYFLLIYGEVKLQPLLTPWRLWLRGGADTPPPLANMMTMRLNHYGMEWVAWMNGWNGVLAEILYRSSQMYHQFDWKRLALHVAKVGGFIRLSKGAPENSDWKKYNSTCQWEFASNGWTLWAKPHITILLSPATFGLVLFLDSLGAAGSQIVLLNGGHVSSHPEKAHLKGIVTK